MYDPTGERDSFEDEDVFPLEIATTGASLGVLFCTATAGVLEELVGLSEVGASSPNILALASAYAFSLSEISTVDLSVDDFLSVLDPDVFRFITFIFPGAGAVAEDAALSVTLDCVLGPTSYPAAGGDTCDRRSSRLDTSTSSARGMAVFAVLTMDMPRSPY